MRVLRVLAVSLLFVFTGIGIVGGCGGGGGGTQPTNAPPTTPPTAPPTGSPSESPATCAFVATRTFAALPSSSTS